MKKEKKYLKGTRIEDSRGLNFGKLTVIELDYDRREIDKEKQANGQIKLLHWYWKCLCECGGETSAAQSNLKRGRTVCCGCTHKQKTIEVGMRFGKLTVVSQNIDRQAQEEIKYNRKTQKYWDCKCDCGNEKIVVAATSTLNAMGSLSCGCLIGENVRKHHIDRARNGNSIMHFLIDKYGEEIALKMTDNKFNSKLNLYEINRGNSDIHIHINCLEKDYHGEFEVAPCHLSDSKKPTGCPYCSNNQGRVHPYDSLGTIDQNSNNLWSDKNGKTPYDYSPKSTQLVWWKCPEGKHDDFQREISDYARAKYDCPYCALERKESMLQMKVRTYLEYVLGYKLEHEWNCSIVPKNPKITIGNNTMPFDNEVVDLKLIIEVHGEQHYKLYSFNSKWRDKTGLNPEQSLHKRKLYDRYKSYVAYKNGYHYLEIPYWTEGDESYKMLIEDKIKTIKEMEGGNCA